MKQKSTRSLYSLLALPLLGGMAASLQAQPDYAPAHWHALCNANWYTSGYGHKFCVVHDMEGYYGSTISMLAGCSWTSDSVFYACNGLTDSSDNGAPPGDLTQMVREAYYAWHACCWNQYSFACEHEGFASNPAWYTEAMYQASGGLYKHWCDGYGIAKDRNHIVAHGEKSNANWVAWAPGGLGINPTCNSHTDPGPYWDWNHYMAIIQGAVNPPYYFDTDANGWTSGNSLSALTWTACCGWPGIIYADQTGNDAFYYSPGTSYTGGNECSINVNVYPQNGNTANHDMQIFFKTAADNTFTAGKSAPIVTYTCQNNWARLNLDVNASGVYAGQTITGLRLDVDNNNSATRWIINHFITQGSLRWRFDSDSMGWTPGNSLSAISWSGSGWPGIIYADQTGNDPQFLSTGGWQMYGGINDTVHVRVYPQNGNTANHDMQIFFASGNENNFSEDKSLTTYYTAKNGWADVYFDFGVNGKWNGDYIRQIRLDVDQINQGNRWIIDSVCVEHNTYASYIHAPTIGMQPTSQTVNQGANVTFSIYPNGPAPFTYQWQKNGVSVSGATAMNLTLNNVQAGDAANYTCVASNSGGNATSSSASLTVNVPPAITTQPQSQTANAGDNVAFTVTASGTAPLSYQWTFNGGNISGATASSLTKSNVQLTDAGSYAVVVSNVAGNATSANAVLTVNSSQPPSITTQPVSQTVNQGANATFSVVANGAIPLSYQWTFNGGNISGATATAFTVSNAQPSNAGSYAVVVTNAYGTVTSSTATLAINIPPSITTQPVSQTVNQGSSATFSVVAAGTAPLSYQWKFNGGNISGATASSYTKSNVQGTDAGSYAVVVTNMAGTVTSANALLSVNLLPAITTQPASQSVAKGASVTFSVIASGTAPLTYQWKFNGADLSGATASSLTKTNVLSTDAGSYAVGITNMVGGVLSANATLTVNSPPTLSLGSSRDVEQVVNFESITDYGNDHVMFRKPMNSGTTSAFVDSTVTNYAMVVTSGIPSGNPNGDGSKAMKASWTFLTGTTSPWLRLDTANSTYIPNPAVDFIGRVRFDIYSDKSIMIALGLRETGTSLAVGANGGTTGSIEWIGATGKTGTGPTCTRTISAGTWTTVEFNLRAESCAAFTGNGVLDGNQGVLEHVAIVPNAGLTTYTVYMDNFQMVYTNNLPTDTVTMNSNSTLTFTASGSDPDAGQTLSYSLVSPPSGASINSSTGAFAWTPTSGGTTNTITVQVADNGVPSQNAQSSFTAIVNNDPLGVMSIGDSALAANQPLKLTWAAAPGVSYQIQAKQGDGAWTNLGEPVKANSTEGAVEIPDAASGVSYRVIELGGAVSDQ